MTLRERLPDRRERTTVPASHIWAPATDRQQLEPIAISFSSYADGRIAEVFIDPREEGPAKTSERTMALRHDLATLISIALQYGAPLEVLRSAVGRSEVNFMGKLRQMPHSLAGTVLDALAREASNG